MCAISRNLKNMLSTKHREQNDTYCITPFILTSNTGDKSHSSGFIDRYVYTHTHTHTHTHTYNEADK